MLTTTGWMVPASSAEISKSGTFKLNPVSALTDMREFLISVLKNVLKTARESA
jgi:hypothetical protein